MESWDMLDEIEAAELDVNEWEADFLASVADWDGDHTEAQADKIEQIYDKYILGDDHRDF